MFLLNHQVILGLDYLETQVALFTKIGILHLILSQVFGLKSL